MKIRMWKMMREKIRKNYCWLIVASCCGLMSASIGIPMNATSVLLAPLADGLGVGMGDISAHRTIMAIATGITAPMMVMLARRIRVNRLILCGALVSTVSHLAISCAQSIWLLYAMAALIGIANSSLGVSVISMVINNWFYERRGFALGLPLSCSGLMGALFSPLLATVLEESGWRMSYGIVALCIAIVSLPAILFLCAAPEEKGLKPYGKSAEVQEKREENNAAGRKPNAGEARILVMLCVANVCVSLPCCLNTHLPNYATGIGFTTQAAALLVSVLMIGNTGCKLVTGILNDNIGLEKTAAIMLTVSGCGAFALVLGHILPKGCAFAASVMLGAAYTAPTVMMTIATKDLFGRERAALFYSYIAGVGSLVSSFGYTAVGYAYDFLGNYKAIFSCAGGLVLAALALIRLSYKQNADVNRASSKELKYEKTMRQGT